MAPSSKPSLNSRQARSMASALAADGVRPAAEFFLQMPDVLVHGEQFKFPIMKPQQHADADIVNARFHRAVKGRDAPVIIPFGTGRMHGRIGLAVVSFLEKLEGADFGFLELLEFVQRGRRDVHVDAPDFSATDLGPVDGVNRPEDVIEPLLRIGFAGHEQQPFVALPDEDLHLAGNFVLRQHLPFQFGVLGAEGAIAALVLAEVGNVERRKQHEPVAVNLVLDPARDGEHFLEQHRVLHFHQGRHLLRVQALEFARLGQRGANAPGAVIARVFQNFPDFRLVNERGGFFSCFAQCCCHG
jgi:hypothetical protein